MAAGMLGAAVVAFLAGSAIGWLFVLISLALGVFGTFVLALALLAGYRSTTYLIAAAVAAVTATCDAAFLLAFLATGAGS